MSFFKKKRFSDVEGYDRISGLIEDRQRGAGVNEDEDDLEEDTVLLSPRERVMREPPTSESVSLVRPPETRDPAPTEPLPSFTRPEAPVTQPASIYAPSAPAPLPGPLPPRHRA